MQDLQYFTSIIEERAISWLDGLSDDPLYDPVRYIMRSGGKRVRPALVLMANQMFGGEMEEAIPTALAVEVFHNFTLMHDDIMDNAPVRRGEATVHEKWNSSTAILSGDAMFALAYEQLSASKSGNTMEMFRVFNSAALVVCEGQQADMSFEERNDVGVQEYLAMIGKKTAALLAASLQLGALSAACPEGPVNAMKEIGTAMGIAFQLQDDLLDAYADTRDLGKRKGGDIISNKKTFLLLSAFERCNQDQRTRLAAALELNGEEKVRNVLRLFDELGIKELTLAEMEGYYSKASKLLSAIAVAEERKAPLRSILDRLTVRVS